MASEPGEISRRRVLAGAAWSAPVILLATSVPARAASGDTYAGSFIHINGLHVDNLNQGGKAEAGFQLQYLVYGSGAFGSSVSTENDAAAAPSFATWAFQYHYEVFSGGTLVYSSTPVSVTLAQGATQDVQNDSINVGQNGSFSVHVVISSGQTSTVNGEFFTNATPDATADVTIT